MLNRITLWLLSLLERTIPLSEEQHVCCQYGIEAFLYTCISTVLLLLLGVASNMFLPAFIIIIVFYFNQTFGGGYHTSTHLRCFLTMTVGLGIGLWIILIPIYPWLFWITGLISCVLLWWIPLTLHPNKAYLNDKKDSLIRRSRILTIIETLLCILFYALRSECLNAFSIGLVLAAISRTAARKIYPVK